jgi:DNA-binding NarL/FixJ family response regulator
MINFGIIEDNTDVLEVVENYLVVQGKFKCTFKLTEPMYIDFKVNEINITHIVICDIGLPGLSGIEVVWRLKKINPKIKILMFTVFKDYNNIFNAIKAGASGYLLKNTALPKLEQALVEVIKGGATMSPEIAHKVLEHFRNPVLKDNQIHGLTARELQITQMLYKGEKYKDIAHNLALSVDTIKFHVKNIYIKLQINSRSQLVKFFH